MGPTQRQSRTEQDRVAFAHSRSVGDSQGEISNEAHINEYLIAHTRGFSRLAALGSPGTATAAAAGGDEPQQLRAADVPAHRGRSFQGQERSAGAPPIA